LHGCTLTWLLLSRNFIRVFAKEKETEHRSSRRHSRSVSFELSGIQEIDTIDRHLSFLGQNRDAVAASNGRRYRDHREDREITGREIEESDRKDGFIGGRWHGCSKMAAMVEGEWSVMRNQGLPTGTLRLPSNSPVNPLSCLD
jgi:hypothetical protein